MKKFRDFESARDFVRSLGLKSQKEWRLYIKSKQIPDNIPKYPEGFYKKDWKGMGDWLGTGTVASQDKVYLPYNEAMEFVRSLGLKILREWKAYCKSGNKPDDIPANPNRTYKKDWKGMGDWLGTGTVAPQDKVYLPYNEAMEFVRSLGLKSQKEWYEYSKSGNKPDDIPSNTQTVYKHKGWKGWGDWLGTGIVAPQDKQYRPHNEAMEFVRSLKLKSQKEWIDYCKSGNKPDDIPADPNQTYKNDFKGYGDFLGTGTIRTQDRVYRPYKEAREFASSLNLKGEKEWLEYCKSGNKPHDIPSAPRDVYKKDWKGTGDFLGTGTVADRDKVFRPYREAREFVKALKLKNVKEWQEYCKSGNKPDDIPAAPWDVYKE